MPNPITDPMVENVIIDDVASVVNLASTPDGTATVTMTRAAAGNALNLLMIEGLTEAFETLQGADHLRVVFLQGEGADFCRGVDPERRATEPTEADIREDLEAVGRMLKALADVPAITVALVQGAVLGDGLGLASACDVVVAMKDARFGLPEVARGEIAAVSLPFVIEAVGPRLAKALAVTGREVGAEEAVRIGLAQELVDDAAGLERAKARLVAHATAAAPSAVAETKRLVWDLWPHKIDQGLLNAAAGRQTGQRLSDDGQEGYAAAIKRRRPSWTR